jgi:hypothetical protein
MTNMVLPLPAERFRTYRNVLEPVQGSQNVLRTLALMAGTFSRWLDPPLAFTERQQGFATLYVNGKFIKLIDLR